MDHTSISMDVSLKNIVPGAAASMDNLSDEIIAIVTPQVSPVVVLPNSPLTKLQNEAAKPPPPSAKREAIALLSKVVAEFLGTFLLIFAVLSALIANEAHGGALGQLGVATAAGTAVAVTVASLARVSGGHLNPAISVAMAAFGYLPRARLAPYVAAQLLGSVGASFVAKVIYSPPDLGAAVATVPAIGAVEALFVEFIITFVLLFVITALSTHPKAAKELIAVGAGAAVMMNVLISAYVLGECFYTFWGERNTNLEAEEKPHVNRPMRESTGASMNPARTLGPAIASGTYTKIWVYMVAQPLGAIAGTGAYVALK